MNIEKWDPLYCLWHITFFKNEMSKRVIRNLNYTQLINVLISCQDLKKFDIKTYGLFINSMSIILQKKITILLMEAKDYIQTLSYKSTQKNPKTQTKILQDPLNKTSYINQEALTFDFENIGNICEDIVAKEIPRNTSQSQEINMSISLVDKFNMIGSSSSKLSEGQSNFKEKLEDNLKFIMNKEADKFLFMNENFSSKNLLETPDFSAEKLDFSYFLKRASYSDPNEDSFVERFAETCRKFQINFVESSSEKNQTEKKKKVDLKATVKKKTIFDKDILLLEKNKNDLLLNEDQNGKAEIEEIKTTNKEKSFITHIVRDQNDKFLSFLTIFKQKKPEVYKKTLLHISNLLDKFDDKDFLNEPEKVRENLEKIRTSPDFIEHYNTEINMESSNSGLSEMKSNLSSFYDSMKKNNFGIDRNNNDDIFVRYYNEGLNTIEETTENFISKTDLNTNTNFQSKSVEKSSNQTPNFKKIDLEHEIDQKSLTLFRFITAKCGENKKKIKFADIVKNCDKSLKVQTFLELLKLNCHQNIQMSQEKIEKFGDVFIGLL